MRLLRRLDCGNFELAPFDDEHLPPYAILSHTWTEGQEVSYNELLAGTGKDKTGYAKIRFCAEQAARDYIQYFWVDTCCIDKTNSTELAEALNSMFRWYRDSQKCYVYLSDVSTSNSNNNQPQHTWEQVFRQSRWFTRGWTLQELVAPKLVFFFSQEGKILGSKETLKQVIYEITDIPVTALSGGPLTDFSIEERLRWAKGRNTKRCEDKAYCLLGIVGVFIAPIYGEGDHAFIRLAEEIDKRYGTSITPTYTRNSGSNVGPSTSFRQTRQASGREVMAYEGFLRSLSYPEMEYRYFNVDDVQDDTCRWFFNHPNYRAWNSGTGPSSLLMIRGKPGSGKSTAMKRAVKIARESSRRDEAVIAYFFNSRGVSMETKLEGFFRSTLHQLLEKHRATDDEAFTEWKRRSSSIRSGWTWTVKELQNMFYRCVGNSTVKITMFVDALDECESASAARDLMDLLSGLILGHCEDGGQSRLKICVSSRHYPNIRVSEPLQIIVEKTNRADITKYIKETLQLQEVSIPEDLSSEITSRSEGIFLWAFLVLEKIRAAIDDGEPLSTLHAIINHAPQRLEELFKELIDSISSDEREQSNLILCWILFAKRPLSLSELCHALAFRTEYPTYQHYETSDNVIRPDQMRRLLGKYTRGLVEVVEIHEEGYWPNYSPRPPPTVRVQFIHESVRQYILSKPDAIHAGLPATWLDPGFADNVLAMSCFNYVKAVCVEREVVKDIVQRSKSPSIDKGALQGRFGDRFFLEYAILFGFEHAKVAETGGLPPSYLMESTTNNIPGQMSWWVPFTTLFRIYQRPAYVYSYSAKHWSEYTTSQLAFACAYRLDSWLDYLMKDNRLTSNNLDLSKALCVTAALGREKSIASLIQAGADVNYDEPKFGSPLTLSLAHGREEFLPILLGHGATVPMGSRKHSPLLTAALHHTAEIVRLLLAHGARIDECEPQEMHTRHAMSSLGMHALEAATRRDYAIMEELLLEAERQQVPAKYYTVAYLAAITSDNGQRHAAALKSAITRLFPEHKTRPIYFTGLSSNASDFRAEVWPDTQIRTLKMMYHLKRGPWADQLMLIHHVRVLRDHYTISDYGIQRESTIHVTLRARWQGINGG